MANACNHLAWSGSPGVTYNVYCHKSSPIPLDAAHRIASGLAVTGYTDCGRFKNYYYVVTAVNGSGESGPSNTAQASSYCLDIMAADGSGGGEPSDTAAGASSLEEGGGNEVVTKYYFFGSQRVAMNEGGVLYRLGMRFK